jgi:Phasin protein
MIREWSVIMPTTQEEKPAKPRSRGRKADRRNPKSGQKTQAAPDQVRLEAEPVGPAILPTEAAPIEAEVSEVMASEAMASEAIVAEAETPEVTIPEIMAPEIMASEVSSSDGAAIAAALEKAVEAPLSGEVLPPEARNPGPPAGLLAMAQAYDDYTRKSWTNGRVLVERLIAARSFDQAIEIQGEFAKQAYANFLVQSERICALYGEWAQQFFRPFDKFAAGWPRR